MLQLVQTLNISDPEEGLVDVDLKSRKLLWAWPCVLVQVWRCRFFLAALALNQGVSQGWAPLPGTRYHVMVPGQLPIMPIDSGILQERSHYCRTDGQE
jgi:hypothetical protein